MAAHTVKLPDGRSVQFPASMSDQEVNQAVSGIVDPSSSKMPTTAPQTAQGATSTPPDRSEGFWHSAASVFGLTPEQGKQSMQEMQQHPFKNTMEAAFPLISVINNAIGTAPGLAKKTGQEASQTVDAVKQGQYRAAGAHAAGTLGYGASTALSPLFGDSLAKSGEQIGSGNIAGGAGTAAGILAPFVIGGAANSKTARALFQNDLAATSHDILNKGAVDVKSKLWDAHNSVSQRVGQLKNDIAAADYQSGKPQIPTADLQSKILDLTDKYRASESNTPAFSTASKRIAELPANLSFKDLADLKSEIGTKWSKTPDGTPDSAAINELRQTIDKKLADRATELDRTKQYSAYNKLWSTLMGYESDGVMGKILNADNGAKMMDILKDPANKSELARTMDSLKNFGLDPDTLKQFQTAHAPLHDYVNQTGMNRLRLVMQHPATAFPGMVAGSALGSATGVPGGTFLGGTAGAVAGARIPARIGAARAVAKLGAPALTGEMADAAQVHPVGSGEPPIKPSASSSVTPPGGNPSGAADAKAITEQYLTNQKAPEYGGTENVQQEAKPTVDTKELTDIGQALGLKKADAIARAKEAAAAHPNDFEAAKYYMAGKKAQAIQATKAVPDRLPNTATNSPEAAAAANEQAAQKLFGKSYDALSLQEKMKVFSEGAKIQDAARAQQPESGSGTYSRGSGATKEQIAARIDEAKKRKK